MSKLSSAQIFAAVKEAFPEEVVEEHLEGIGAGKDPVLVVRAGRFAEIAKFCRDDARLQFDLLSLISGVDYPDRNEIECIYCLDSIPNQHWLILKVLLPREDPRIASVESIWRTADWHERETFDLMGIIFEGHHNLIRILCAEDWVGHPLRKDYVIPDTYHGVKNVIY